MVSNRIGFVLLLALVASPALGQGACPDGLQGPCCTSAVPSLPPLPPVTWLDARQLCVIDCNATPDQYFQLTMSPPAPVASGCGTDFDVTLTSSGPELCPMPGANTLRLNYTRRWQQAFPGLGNLLVYRFVATGALCVTPGFCNIESPPQHPFVFGFVDYAFQASGPPPCSPSFVGAAIALGHSCDAYMHDASCAFTQDPISSHPVDEYLLVAPGSNFTPNLSMTPPQGPSPNLPRVGLRWIQPGSAGTCNVREPITNLVLTNVGARCPCLAGTPPPNTPYWRQTLRAVTACGSSVTSTPICPFGPPTVTTPPFDTLTAWSIGSWGMGAFPGLPGPGNRFFLAQGSASVQSTAAAPCPVQPVRTVYYGVENRWAGGQRVDLVDNAQQIPGTVIFQPVVGGTTPPGVPSGTHVLYFY